MQDMHFLFTDGEKNAIDMGTLSVEQLSNIGWDKLAFGGQPTAFRKVLKRANGIKNPLIPIPCGTLIELGNPFDDESDISLGWHRYLDLVPHGYFKKGYFCSSCSKTTSASSSSPASMAARPNLIPSRASSRTANASIR